MRAADYRAWVLLPFNEEQIREYLQGILGPERVEAALDLCAAVHNLRELAQRPSLLSLIANHIGALEARQARGDVVRGVTLYDELVEAWLARDRGKHHLRPEDKLTLMEDMAADMWQEAAREWAWRRVLAWLGTRLARYLLRALLDNAPEKWDMPLPSPETLDFLGQLLATAPARQQAAAIRVLEHLLGSYRPQATDIALRYWLLAMQQNVPAPTPLHVDLHGADLSGLTIRGRSPVQPLPLVDANLAQARLVATRFEHVDLLGANLTRAQAERAEFHHVSARSMTVAEADLTAAVWRHCDALDLRGGESADWYECQWIACDIDPATLPEDFGRRGTLSRHSDSIQPVPDIQDGEVATVFGHTGQVSACGYAPDGATIVSGAGDGTLKVWDAQTGDVCMTLLNAPDGQTAAMDERHNHILAASPGAWRYLGWRIFDPHANRLRILPAEHFGPLPAE